MIPGSERSPGEGNGNPLQYSCLENPMDRGEWRAVGHDLVTKQQRNNKTPFTANFIYMVPPPLNVINTGSGSIDMAFRKW